MDTSALTALWEDTLPRGALDDADIFFTVRPKTLERGAAGVSVVPTAAPARAEDAERSAKLALESSGVADSEVAPSGSLRLLGKIGRGGMGVIYRACQESLEREVAVKKIRRDRLNPESRAEFLAEARLTGRLSHPNIVPVHDLGLDARGRPSLVMKRVEGWSWRQLLDARKKPAKGREKVLKLTDHLGILIQICDALSFAHARDIVHLDLKPDNVMIGSFGEVLLMDWGVALSVGSPESAASSGIAHKSAVTGPLGTPAYFAPELAEGRGDDIGPRTDVYLLGALLYEILQGRPPHQGKTLYASVLHAVEEPSPRVTRKSAPRELRRICRRAMAAEPAKRIASPRRFQALIKAYLEHRESGIICERAELLDADCRERLKGRQELSEEKRNKLYADFAEAAAGYSQALVLWDKNKAAQAGQVSARAAYAEAALRFGDFGLAQAQAAALPRGAPEAERLKRGIAEARRKAARTRAAARWSLVGAAVAVLAILGGLILFQRLRQSEQDKLIADQKLAIAESARGLAESARGLAEAEARRAEAETRQAEAEARQAQEEQKREQAGRERIEQTLAALFEAEDSARRGRNPELLEKKIERFLELSNHSMASMLAAAEVYAEADRFKRAEVLIRESYRRFPLKLEPVFALQRLKHRANPTSHNKLVMTRKLIAALESGEVPESELSLYIRGQLQSEDGDHAGAIETFTAIEKYTRSFPWAYFSRGNARFELGQFEAALVDFQRALELNRTNPLFIDNTSAALVRLGRLREAYEMLGFAVQLNPKYTRGYKVRAELAERFGDPRAAEFNYSAAIGSDPNDPEPYTARGILLARRGQIDSARRDFDRAIELDPGDVLALANRGIIFGTREDHARALRDFDQALAANPRYEFAVTNRGITYLNIGKLAEARADFTRAIALNPRAYLARHCLARIDLAEGRAAEAEAGFSLALQLRDDPATYLERAKARQALKRLPGAREDLRAILTRFPASPQAAEARSLLDALGQS